VKRPSLRASAADLLGEDPYRDQRVRARLPVAQAARRCPRGQVIAARRGDKEVCVVVLEDGRAFVVPDRCPHDGGLLSDGFVEDGRLVCARHGWEFDPATGRCPTRPGVILESCPVRPRRQGRSAAGS
jgi:nitrite reductase/ring-hydroxylating ferredoxin subunit